MRAYVSAFRTSLANRHLVYRDPLLPFPVLESLLDSAAVVLDPRVAEMPISVNILPSLL